MTLLNQQQRIAVLIPCYNEAQSIGRVVADFQKALPGAVVYVYDNAGLLSFFTGLCLVWYLLLANHSYLHWWFTYRLQAVTVVCLLFMIGKNVSLHGLKH